MAKHAGQRALHAGEVADTTVRHGWRLLKVCLAVHVTVSEAHVTSGFHSGWLGTIGIFLYVHNSLHLQPRTRGTQLRSR
eukprot:1619937-Prymnesium_polylepis.1